MPITSKIVNKAPIKERRGTPKVNPRPKTIPIMAPTAAPLETPRIKGSARGFLRRAWNTTPPRESVKPTSPANKILGNRILNRIIHAVWSTGL
ncbi:unnamed protein product [marine sediment metagenome]|uniref:Uncharacterized protein n=1 Tax=marine sediment metagenome TaxID=412755 RepID=X0UVQ0_9ZZZZ